MIKTSYKNLWTCLYDGKFITIKATFEEMESTYQNDPKMSDYRPLEVYKFNKKGNTKS